MSQGYEEVAADFMRARNARIGPSNVREWSRRLARGATVLEIACGHGVVSQVLIEEGLTLYGIDASPTLVAAFRERFLDSPVQCARVEDSDFFGRTFDGVVAWGLLFLMPPASQIALIHRVARALNPGGRFLFTAPEAETVWTDSLSGQESISLGRDAYNRTIEEAGLQLEGEDSDIGENHYWFALRI